MEKVIMNTLKMESSVADSCITVFEKATMWDLIEKYVNPNYKY